MRTILHQALKDARLLKWLLGAWALLLAVVHVVAIVVSRSQPIDPDTLSRLTVLETICVVLATAVFIVAGASLVQHDSPISPTAFWLTRPVSRPAMLVSKLGLALIVLAGVPLLLDALDFAAAGLSLWWFPPFALVFQLAWLLPVMAIAAITVSLPQFLLITLFEIVLCAGLTSVAYGLGFRSTASPAIVLTTAMAMLGTALLAYLYLTRHLRSSAVLFGIAPVVISVALVAGPQRPVPVDWPWGDPKDYPDAGQAGLTVSLDPSALTVLRTAGGVTLHAPLTVNGLPSDREVFASVRASYHTGSDRIPLQMRTGWYSPVAGDGTVLLKGILDGASLINPRALLRYQPTLTVLMSPGDFDRVKDRTGRLHADLMLGVYEYQTRATAAVRPGATFDPPGSRVQMLRVEPRGASLSIIMRSAISGWYGWYSYAGATGRYLLRSRRLGQAAVGSARGNGSFGGDSSYSNITRMLMPVPLHLSVGWSDLEFHFNQPGAKSDEATDWLQDAELIGISRPSAGHWRAVIDLPGIRLSDLPTRPDAPGTSR